MARQCGAKKFASAICRSQADADVRNGVLERGERGWQQLRSRGRRIADVKFAEFDARRAKIVVSGRRKPEGEAVVKAIRETGGITSFFQADTSREPAAQARADTEAQPWCLSRWDERCRRVDGRCRLFGRPDTVGCRRRR